MRARHPFALLAAAAALAACADATSPAGTAPSAAAPLRAAAAGQGIAGQYIVVLEPGANPRSVAAVAQVDPQWTYTSVLNGFAAQLNAGQLTALRHNPAVRYVEQAQRGGIQTTQSPATWGLDRIDQRYLPLSSSYAYTSTGAGVRVYVFDSGIYTGHGEFGGRASSIWDYAGGSGTGTDCNGHGTHVAATVGGATYGVAKGVSLRSVRVVDCNGYGSTATMIAALEWVRLNYIAPAVANMSLGWPYSAALNTATASLVNAGVFAAVAAGNDSQDACNVSPASTPEAVTVAASGSNDARAGFSNYGPCTDLYAPGVGITSAGTASSTATSIRSGTSMAAPHVAGMAALFKGTYGDVSSSTLTGRILNITTPGLITGNPAGTPNRLLYTSSL